MEYLFNEWGSVKDKIRNKCLLLLLDYDGTLAPIREVPHKALISEEVRKLLKKLSEDTSSRVVVISGRALNDIKEKVNLKNIVYVGNHGLEVEGPKIKFEAPVSRRYKTILQDIKSDLTKKFSAVKGILLEDKGLSVSLHYRLVDEGSIPKVNAIFHEAVTAHVIKNRIKVRSGKMVFEVRPPLEWDKGKIVLWLLARQRFVKGEPAVLPVYLGDDLTDEDAFKALEDRGITIFVGKSKHSYARYYLKDTEEVKELLGRILELEEEKELCPN
ncbi:MAG: trehalose-phosphatase [Candidatus Omnitrophota bacterium]